VIQMANPD